MGKPLLSLLVVVCLLSSCVSITPEAKGVMLYSQDSTLLGGCKRLGSVASEINLITRATRDDGATQVKNNLRDQAFQKYRADSVVLLNLDVTMAKASAEGIALRCNDPIP
jgi:hypothetical protein